jgi:subtilisin
MKFGAAFAALSLLIAGLLALQHDGASAAGRRVPNGRSYFVTFRDDFDGDGDRRDDAQERRGEDDFVREHHGEVRGRYSITDAVAIEVAPQDYAALTADPRVESVEPDLPVSILDAELDASWGVKAVGSETNHTAGYRGAGVKIGIIDTGVNTTHVDIAPHYSAACSYDFVNNDSDPTDDHGHGSHVAGTAAGADNNTGVVGMAPDATICAYKVLGVDGSGSYSAILSALNRAVTDGVDVVNLSLGSGYPGSTVQTAFANAHAAGLTIVAAAGNASPCTTPPTLPPADNEIYPAKFPDVIAVAATDSTNVRACFSSVGADVEIAAPGAGIVSAYKGASNAFASMSGTSMATPHVAGLAAVLLGCGVNLANDDVAQVIDSTALDLDSPLVAGTADGRDTWFGFGLIRAANAASSVGCQAGSPAPTSTATSTNTPTRTNTPTNTPTRTNTPTNTPTRTNTPTSTAPAGPTNTPTNTPTRTNTPPPPTNTPTRTNTPVPPTNTPTATATGAPASGPFLFSVASTVVLSGQTFENEDIVSWNGSAFSMFFDGSDVMSSGVVIDGFAVVSSNDLLITLAGSATISGLGSVDDSDILRFRATSLGANTTGTWTMYFDASDVGLTTDAEDVDGIELLTNGKLLISTAGDFSVPGLSGQDRDIILFTPSMLGWTSTGTFSMYFDGSDVGVDTYTEDIDGVAVAASGSLYLSTIDAFSVTGLSGQDEDVFVFAPGALGSATTGTFVSLLFFDGSAYGLSANDVVDIDLP